MPAYGYGTEGVVYRESPGHIALESTAYKPLGLKSHSEIRASVYKLYIRRLYVRALLKPEAFRPAGCVLQYILNVLIIAVYKPCAAL